MSAADHHLTLAQWANHKYGLLLLACTGLLSALGVVGGFAFWMLLDTLQGAKAMAADNRTMLVAQAPVMQGLVDSAKKQQDQIDALIVQAARADERIIALRESTVRSDSR